MLLMIDNYDCFTYNLVQYLGELGADVEVHRNDAITLEQIAAWRRSASSSHPGPARPTRRASRCAVIQRFAGDIPILGVCLGHQAIGQAFGGNIVRARQGDARQVVGSDASTATACSPDWPTRSRHALSFAGYRTREPARVSRRSPPKREDGEIMGVRHRDLAVEGVQFHPEAILTEHGHALLSNFLNALRRRHVDHHAGRVATH